MTQQVNEEHEYTLGEFEEMDLSDLENKVFMVAISTGPRDQPQFLSTTICGPLNFYEMVETVGKIYEDQLVHAKAMICSKEFGEPPQVLDEKTMDFIEARHEDIIMDGLLGGELTEDKEYTCTAGFIKYDEEEV